MFPPDGTQRAYQRRHPETTPLYEVVRDNLATLDGAIDEGACLGRRMNQTAANLMEYVLPAVPLRQWVLTFPFAWRGRLAQDGCWSATAARLSEWASASRSTAT